MRDPEKKDFDPVLILHTEIAQWERWREEFVAETNKAKRNGLITSEEAEKRRINADTALLQRIEEIRRKLKPRT